MRLSSIGLITNRKISEHNELFAKIVSFLSAKKKSMLFDQNCASPLKEISLIHREEIFERADVVICLGGDGTVLKAARMIPEKKKVPVLSVNLGNLGFLTEVKPDNIEIALDQVFVKKKFFLDNRSLLRVTVYREGAQIFTSLALNDVVINQGNFARLITLKTEIDRQKITTIKADGLIVSTPTGSTGHSLSANGPIVNPAVEAFILTPICPAGLSHRPIVIPNNGQIKIVLETERRIDDQSSDVGLTLDGQLIFGLKSDDEISIRKSNRVFYLIRLQKYSYYQVLREKLRFGQ